MMLRAVASSLVVWALVGVPTLCVAGALPHACVCDATHSHDEEEPCGTQPPGCPHDGDCNHESDCGSDPCAGAVVRAERLDQPDIVLQPAPPALSDCTAELFKLSHRPHLDLAEPSPHPLPVHLSDIPLLI